MTEMVFKTVFCEIEVQDACDGSVRDSKEDSKHFLGISVDLA